VAIRSAAGFTLIELVMVMVMSGILLATATPLLFRKSAFAERVLFDDTLNAVRYAQKLAVVTGCHVQVAISSDSYELKRRGSSGSSVCPVSGSTYAIDVVHPGTNDTQYTGQESGVTLTGSPTTFIFYPLGNASSDVTLTINNSRTITVVGETGFVYDSTP
jgi:MSHA pilin protein MshC